MKWPMRNPFAAAKPDIMLARIHGDARVEAIASSGRSPQFRVETEQSKRAAAASFKIRGASNIDGSGAPYAVFDLEVESGEISICCMKLHSRRYLSREEFVPAGIRRSVYVPIPASGRPCRVMIRNGIKPGRSIARIHGMALRRIAPAQAGRANTRYALWEVGVTPPFRCSDSDTNGRALGEASARLKAARSSARNPSTIPILVTHTSRQWDWQRSSQEFLRKRYDRPGRFDKLPPFDELPPIQDTYSGRITLFDLVVAADEISLTPTRCIDSQWKVQHACEVGGKLVISMEDHVLVLPSLAAALAGDGENVESPEIERIDDPWFAGMHTVFPVDASRCLVSASGPDAVLLLDLEQRRVVRRWRVPAERYGRNYELTEQMSVHDHYIDNDVQLAHLNCAYPDGRGGFWISTLGQGDIAHVSADGEYDLIATGFVGCHGIRYSNELAGLYFSDTCTGRVIGIGADRKPQVIGAVESRWLHDALHLGGGVFLLCVGDRNRLAVFDATANKVLASFDMRSRGENVQFLNFLPEAKPSPNS